MPELPEVEITRRGFATRIAGARIEALRMGRALRWPLGIAPEELVGRQILQVRRRGKYLLLDLDAGVLLLHLGMSGRLCFDTALPPAGKHDHVDLRTTQGTLRLHDPRRFGALVWSASADADMAKKLLSTLGVEPLEPAFQPEPFYQALRRRTAAIKQVLLAGDCVVGVGNIYACEALFRAGIRPTVRAARLSRPRVQRLHAAIRAVLEEAIARGGSTLRDFAGVHGELGYFQLDAAVYGREGLPCRRCHAPIRKVVQGARSSYFCSHCQQF